MIALIVILCAALVGGGTGVAVYWFVLKPKQTPKKKPAPAANPEDTIVIPAVAETPKTEETPVEEGISEPQETPAEEETSETETK